MPRTTAIGDQIRDGSIQRVDLDAATPGAAVVRRLIAGANITLAQTGPDSGTGDVTISAASGGSATPIDWVGGVSGALPAIPPANITRQSSFAFGGFVRPVYIQSDGNAYSAQPALYQRAIYSWVALNNAVPNFIGIGNGTNTGTITNRSITPGGTLLAASRRFGFVTAATAGALTGNRQVTGFLYFSNAANVGGFYSVVRFGITGTSADARMFIGWTANTAAPTNVEPNTINNSFGIGKVAASANLQFISRNTATATTTDLGASFPVSANAVYEVGAYIPPNSVLPSLYVRRLDVPAYIEFLNVSANVPVVNTLLTFNHWICNNATAVVAGIDIMVQYAEAPQ